MGKAAQKVGLMTEELSALKYTADLAGVGFESLQTSLVRLTRSMSEVAKGGESDAAKAFQVLGISVTNADGSLRSAAEVMGDVAQKFSEFKDGAEKTALAVAIFGRAGADMIPLLNQGRDAIAASNEEAKKLGVTIGSDLARDSERLNDNLSRMQYAINGVFVAIANELAPTLADLSDKMVEWVKKAELFRAAGEWIRGELVAVQSVIITLRAEIAGLAAIWESLKNIFTKPIEGTIIDEMRRGVAVYNKELENALVRVAALKQANAGLLSGASPILSANGFTGGAVAAKPNAPTLASASSGGGGGASTPESEYDAEKARIEGKLQAIREGILEEQQLKLEKFEADQNLVDEAYQKEIISAEQHKEYMLGLEKKYQEELAKIRSQQNNKALTDTASFLGSMAKVTESWGKKNNAVSKALGIAQALISTYVGATKALELPFPANLAAFAATLAKGLAAVASITAVNPNGQSGAGNRSVGGGAAAPVAVTPEQAPRSAYINVYGSTFNREQMRDLTEQLGSFFKDGGGNVVFAR
jgi:hypothetical protein